MNVGLPVLGVLQQLQHRTTMCFAKAEEQVTSPPTCAGLRAANPDLHAALLPY